ncbi:MAG: aldehyde dehydrogenase family protein [Chloroflexi bacterium]|nr:MAG: aldehyde dehydrogenase family protein [Chloroflexota bacterium]
MELRQRRDRHDPEGACGRRGDHYTVELPHAAGNLEAGARTRGRLHHRHQAGDLHAVHDVRAGAHPHRGGRACGGRERRDGLGQDRGRPDRRFAAGRQGGVHGLDRGRAAGDAGNLQGAVIGALFGIYMNAGQVCQAGSRLLVEESVHDQFLNMFSNFVNGVKVGDPMDPSTRMGPVVSDAQLGTVESYVKAGNDEKATLVRGGKRLTGEGYDKGYFYEPTIFDRVDNRMKIAQEESFGPVLSVIPFKDADEGLRLANDTMYGLAAAVWTKDIDRAFKFAKGIKAGTVWINSYHAAGTLGVPLMPFGGYKQSGIGRELGQEGMEMFMETKSVSLKLN